MGETECHSGSRTAARRLDVRLAVVILLLVPIFAPALALGVVWAADLEAGAQMRDRLVAAAEQSSNVARVGIEMAKARLSRLDAALGDDPQTFVLGDVGDGPGFVGLYSADGITINRDGSHGASVADNDDFKALASGAAWRITPLIGERGALQLFGVAKRLERNADFAGVMTQYFSADFLAETWSSLGLGSDSTLGLIRDDGWLIARFPTPERTINLSKSLLFTEGLARSPSGVYLSPRSPVDGIARYVGFRTLDDLGIIAIASISQDASGYGLGARIQSAALITAPVFIALLALCGWTALLLRRQEKDRTRLEAALSNNKVLLQDIHHRVKNNLQSVSAMIQLEAGQGDLKDRLVGRISAMSAVHQHIYETDQFGVLDAKAYVERILTGLAKNAPPGVTLSWRLSPFELEASRAMPLGLLVNELVTNAFKHGFPGGRSGTVLVILERDGERAHLVVSDDGVGKSDHASSGLGSRLLRAFYTQLNADTETRTEAGLSVDIRFPAT